PAAERKIQPSWSTVCIAGHSFSDSSSMACGFARSSIYLPQIPRCALRFPSVCRRVHGAAHGDACYSRKHTSGDVAGSTPERRVLMRLLVEEWGLRLGQSEQCRQSRLADDHGADALVREQLSYERVGHAAIDDVHALHALQGAAGRLHFRQHSTGYHAGFDELRHVGRVQLRNQLAILVAYPHHVGEEDELLRAKGSGELTRAQVGADVVGDAALAQANGRDHRDVAFVQRSRHRPQVNALDAANEPQVTLAGEALALEQLAVDAADADGLPAKPVDHGHQLLLDLAHQHHLDHFHGLLVGDAQTLDRPRLLPDALQPPANVVSATVHQDDVDLQVLEPHDVLNDGVLGRQGAAAHLDHDGLAQKVVDVGQRLLQDARDVHIHYSYLCRVIGVQRYVFLRHIAAERHRRPAAQTQRHFDNDQWSVHGLRRRGWVEARRPPSGHQPQTVQRHAHSIFLQLCRSVAQGHEDAAPVGIVTVHGALQEVGGDDLARRGVSLRV